MGTIHFLKKLFSRERLNKLAYLDMFRVLIRVFERERAFYTGSTKHCPEDITRVCYESLLFESFFFKP